jgi:hypothetical protein
MKRNDDHYLQQLLEPWIGLADNDDAIIKYRLVDPNDEHQ